MTGQVTSIPSAPVLAAGTVVAPVRTGATRASAPKGSASGGSGSPEAAVAQVNQHLEQAQTDLKMQVDADSGRTVFRVVQQGTGEVVLQVPSEEVLGMSRRVREMEGQTGALVDQKG